MAGASSAKPSNSISLGFSSSPATTCPENSPAAPNPAWVPTSARTAFAVTEDGNACPIPKDFLALFLIPPAILPPVPPDIASNTATGTPLFKAYDLASFIFSGFLKASSIALGL